MRKSRWSRCSILRSGRGRPSCRPLLEGLEPRRLLATNITQYHVDEQSTGANLTETQLTPSNVNATDFGQLYNTPLDGQVYAEPLVLTNVAITAGPNTVGTPSTYPSVVFVATQNDSLYAINAANGAILWHRTFLDTTNPDDALPGATSVTTIPSADTDSTDINPEVGITSTPVIDPSTDIIYVLPNTKEIVGGNAYYVQRLHAINVSDGTDAAPSFVIGTTTNGNTNSTPVYVNGTGDGNVNGVVQFNALRENNRPALSLVNGMVYAEWASHSDNGPYHGWVVEWNITNLSTQGMVLAGVLCTDPNGGEGGIWGGGGGLTFDPDETFNGQPAFYFETGNGDPRGGPPPLNAEGLPSDDDYYESLVKVEADPTTTAANQNSNGWGLKIVDDFTPYNVNALDDADEDFGSGSPLVLPDSAGIPGHPHLIVAAGKEGTIYLLDRDNLGKFNVNDDNVLNSVYNPITGVTTPPVLINGSLSTPAYYHGTLYWVAGYDSNAWSYVVAPNPAPDPPTVPVATLEPTSETANIDFGFLPGSVMISADGSEDPDGGIVWIMDLNNGELHAYSTQSLSTELWNSGPGSISGVKFAVPTVANGQVFVGTQDSLQVFGITGPGTPAQPPNTPANLTAQALSGSAVELNWADSTVSPNFATNYAIQELIAPNTYATVANAGPESTSYTITGLNPNSMYVFRIVSSNAGGSSPPSGTITVTTTNQTGQTPTAPLGLGATPASGSEVYLTWTNTATNETGFTLTRATDSLFTQNVVVETLASAPYYYTDGAPGMSPGNTYYYKLQATNSSGLSSTSNIASVTIPNVPAAPTDATAVPNGNQVVVSWTDNAGPFALGYQISRSVDGGPYTIYADRPETSNSPPSTQTFTDTNLALGHTYTYEIVAENVAGFSAAAYASASVLEDTTTQGNWMGTYGAQGYDIVSGPSSLPANDTIAPAGESIYTWTTTSTDPRALQVPGSSNRVAAVWYSATSFTVDVNLGDGQTHDLELYFLDWDKQGRSEQVQITNAATGAVLSTQTVSSFQSGIYLDYTISGNVLITITREAGTNAVLNGLFLDSPPGPTATLLEQDTTTQGTWIQTYGAQGYDVIGSSTSLILPSYATVTPAGQSTWTWASSTTDPRALQVAGGASRIAAAWYSATSFTVDVDLTDGQQHDLELYFLDWDSSGRSEQVQITNAATGAVLSTQTVSSFQSGTYLDYALSGNVLITFTREAGTNAVLNGLFLNSPPGPTATFLEQDTTTQGTWIKTYGAQGYDVIGSSSSVSIPSYATVTPSGQSGWTWASSTTDPRALQIAGGASRIAAAWYATTSFTVDVDLTGGQQHDLELYFLDWDSSGRSEQVQITNAATGAVLSTQTVSSFQSGIYLDYTISGNVLITITREAGTNAVLNGLFLDAPPGPTATLLEQDTTTQGTWIHTYGAQGYDVIGSSTSLSLPSYATVTPAGQATWTWASSTTDPRALQVAGGASRIAAAWYSATSFTVDVDLTDGQQHDLELYFLDWDKQGRSEQVQITNAATGAVLSTQTVSSFQSGIYLDYAISGNVLITITKEAGSSAVLNGLFFGSTATPTPTSTATFLEQDTTTQGTWIHTYGAQGYDVIGSSTSLSLPSYATVAPAGQSTWTWASSTTDPRAPQVAGGASRIAAAWYSATSFTVDVDLTDGQQHDLELYFLDWDKQGRSEQVQITNAATGAVLSTQTVSSFQSGIYLDYTISGNVLITITKEAGTNAVLSGLFLDPTVSGSASIGGLSSDRTGDRPVLQASTDGVQAAITDFPGAVVDVGLAAGPGASSAGPAPPAVAADLTGKPTSGVSVPVTVKGPRPDGHLLRAVARRFARRPSGLIQQTRLDIRWPLIRRFGQ